MNYKVGDKVSVVDLRDGAIVERETTITALETVTLPGKSEPTRMASLACGYGVSVRCLQPVA